MQHGDERRARREQQSQQPLAARAAYPNGQQLYVLFRHHARLQALGRAEPKQGDALGAEVIRHRQGRIDMAAGAARHDHNRSIFHSRAPR